MMLSTTRLFGVDLSLGINPSANFTLPAGFKSEVDTPPAVAMFSNKVLAKLATLDTADGALEERQLPLKREANEAFARIKAGRKVMLFGVDLASCSREQPIANSGHELTSQSGTASNISRSWSCHEQTTNCHEQHIDLSTRDELENSMESAVTSCRQKPDGSRLEVQVPDGGGLAKLLETENCNSAPQRHEDLGRRVPGKRKLRQTLIFPEKGSFEQDSKIPKKASSFPKKLKQKVLETEGNSERPNGSPSHFRLTETKHINEDAVVNLSAVAQRDCWWTRVKQVLDSSGTTLVFGLNYCEATGTATYSSLRKLSSFQRKVVLKQVSLHNLRARMLK